MMNESKRSDPRSWKKWEKSGAVSTPPQVLEKREKESEVWLQEQYRFDLSKVPKQLQEELVQKIEGYYSDYAKRPSKTKALEALQAHPMLSLEEMKTQDHGRLGTTNNFWNDFFPDVCEGIKEKLKQGHLPEGFPAMQLIYWQIKDILMPAFGRVGFDRAKRMHQAIKTFETLDREWKQRVSGSPTGIPYGIRFIPESPLIPDEEKVAYIQSELEFKNTLRLLAIEITKSGIPFAAMHR